VPISEEVDVTGWGWQITLSAPGVETDARYKQAVRSEKWVEIWDPQKTYEKMTLFRKYGLSDCVSALFAA